MEDILKSLRFLVISRKKRLLNKIQNILNNLGFNTECIGKPDEGLKKAMSGNFDVLLIDMTSKGFDWNRYLKKISEAEVSDYVVVIADEKNIKRALKSVNIETCIYLNYPLDTVECQLVLFNISTSAVIKKEVLEKEKHLMHLEVFNEIARKT